MTTVLEVTLPGGLPHLTVVAADGALEAATGTDGRFVRVALRGKGDVEIRFAFEVDEVEVRGGYAFPEPGSPYVVRAPVDGWLSVSARRSRPRAPRRRKR